MKPKDAPIREMFDERLLRVFAHSRPLPVAVVYPCDAVSLRGAVLAARKGIIAPVLIGPEPQITELAAGGGLDIEDIDVKNVEFPADAAVEAAALAKAGEVAAIMKGSLHTNDLMRGIVAKEAGLRTARRMSHIFVIDHPQYHKPLFITDAALNIAPDLAEKRDITQNAIDFAHRMGIAEPKVAIMAAVETVEEHVESTLHAAALSKMADRGQITGALVDGPLALDLAISKEAVKIKGLKSSVAGDADVLVVPNYEAGNMLAKEMEHVGGARTGGIVVGARIPIILTSRSDSIVTRIASSLLANAAAYGVR